MRVIQTKRDAVAFMRSAKLPLRYGSSAALPLITVASSHVPMLSHANEVARLIIDAAKGVPID